MPHFRKSLRNKNIDYRKGRYFVTIQVALNKYLLGAIVGTECVLNELGKSVETELVNLPLKYPELRMGPYVIMPNHVHMILDISPRNTNKENHLSFLVGRFKFIYGKLKREGKVPDIGTHLWQFDYWDDLISSSEEFLHFVSYIRNNPRNWSRDRWGGCYSVYDGRRNTSELPETSICGVTGICSFGTGTTPHCLFGARDFSPAHFRIGSYLNFHECPGTGSASTRTY